MWELVLTAENTQCRFLETLMSCEMHQDSAVKLSPWLAHPLTPK